MPDRSGSSAVSGSRVAARHVTMSPDDWGYWVGVGIVLLLIAGLAASLTFPAMAAGSSWPQFRGPTGQGLAEGQDLLQGRGGCPAGAGGGLATRLWIESGSGERCARW